MTEYNKKYAKERIPPKEAVMATAAAVLATTSISDADMPININLPLINPRASTSCTVFPAQLLALSAKSGLMFASGIG